MSGKYVFLLVFVSADIAALSACLVLYLRRRGSGETLPSALWVSYPLLVALLVLVPLIIVFEDVMVTIILAATAVALYVLAIVARGYHRFAYPRGRRFRSAKHDYSFNEGDEEKELPF